MAGTQRPLRGAGALAIAVVALAAAAGWGAVEGSPIPLSLTLPGKPGTDGKLDGPGAVVCYNLTLSDAAVREVVWWEKGRLALRLEPCVGKPHLRASVYGCPSEGARSVWEYMSPKMRADLVAQVLAPWLPSAEPSAFFVLLLRHVLPHGVQKRFLHATTVHKKQLANHPFAIWRYRRLTD